MVADPAGVAEVGDLNGDYIRIDFVFGLGSFVERDTRYLSLQEIAVTY
jgi:hypothetical protein